MKQHTIIIALAIWTLASLAAEAPAQSSDDSRRFWDKYSIIVQRNIFLRNRYQPGPDRGSGERRRPDQPYVLTGLVKQDETGEYIAFVEDRRNGSTMKLKVGESVGPGKLTAIDFDAVEFDLSGRRSRVEIGMPLEIVTGYATETVSPTTAPTAAAGTAADTTASTPAESGDLAERMKQRRMKEMGQ